MAKAITVFNRIIATLLLIAAVVVLVVSSLTTIYYDMHIDVDWPQYGKENIPMLGAFVLGALAVFFVFMKLEVFKNYARGWIIALGIITVYCLVLIFSIRPLPVDDAMLMEKAARQFETGDYSALTDAGGYLFIWPFQLGYFGYTQILAKVFGSANYTPWFIMQLLCILLTVFLIYKMTWELFEDRDTCGIVALLSIGALFFYNYVTFLYGDIVSMAPQTLALYMMILFLKREKIWYALVSALAIALAIVLKSNCEIALIAIIMVLIGSAFISSGTGRETVKKGAKNSGSSTKLTMRIALAAVFLIAVFAGKRAVDTYYCNLTGLEKIPGGSPAWSHIAMGLQESELEDGWYNGYNYDVFAENDYDTAKTSKAAKANIKETLSDFVKRPLHAGRFFLRKFTTQWTDSVCISTHNLDLVSRHVEDQPWLCDFLVFGQGSTVLIWIMNVFMPVCYIGVAIYLIGILFRRKAKPQEMLLLILIFGGIVFHEFWEGSSRYTMRYYIYWMPYGAYGIRRLFGGKFRT